MKVFVDKMPEIREDCMFYKGKKVYLDALAMDMTKITLYTHHCIDGKECDFSCDKCSRLKVLK
jgi:hypothetical protein